MLRFVSALRWFVFFFLRIRRPPRSTQSRSSAASDVYKRQSQLRTNISTVQTENNALSYAINSYVDVNHICKVAKSKLGMKQASDNQIITYKSSDSGYTLQYGDIPNK